MQFDMRDIDGLFAEPLKKFQFISVAAGSAIQDVGFLWVIITHLMWWALIIYHLTLKMLHKEGMQISLMCGKMYNFRNDKCFNFQEILKFRSEKNQYIEQSPPTTVIAVICLAGYIVI